MIQLGVNIDHVATVRQARKIDQPDPVFAAVAAELGGANSIVCHLREDRRHIQDHDLLNLRSVVKTRLNLEMAMSEEIIKIALDVKPDQITIVPERREEITTEGGLDVISHKDAVKEVVEQFKYAGIDVSVFIDPVKEQIECARLLNLNIVEINTGHYSSAKEKEAVKKELTRVRDACKIAKDYKLFVAAGHGLNYSNVVSIVKIPEIQELNIGHSIVSRAIFVGMQSAVSEMKSLIDKYSH